MLLGKLRFSGAVAVNIAQGRNPILEMPPGASFPGYVSIRNTHATAIVYLKTASNRMAPVDSSNAGVELRAGEAFTWINPTSGAFIVGVSTVDGTILRVEANWADQDAKSLDNVSTR